MTPERAYISRLLQDLQDELAAQGLWAAQAPEPAAFASVEPFCIDTLALEHWLQFVFIGRLHSLLEEAAPLPATCAIEPYAQKAFAAQPGADALLRIIGKLDIMITRAT